MTNFIHLKNNENPTLIIIPHAGGLPTQYQSWSNGTLEKNFNILIYNKPKVSSWNELVQQCHFDINQINAEELYIFGHSMGALLAFCATCEIHNKKITLILSGMNPPSLGQIKRFQELANLSLDAFIEKINEIGGVPAELYNAPEMLQRMSKHIQSDFHLLSSFPKSFLDKRSHHSFNCVISLKDRLCQLNKMSKWNTFFNSSSTVKVFPGDHFYLFEFRKEVHDYLLEIAKN